MKKTLLLVAASVSLLWLSSFQASAWGKREHAAIAFIAEQNLSNKAKKGISEILGEERITSYASWLDYYRPEMLLKLSKPQKGKMVRTIPHTFHVDASLNAYPNPEHSSATMIAESVEKLKHRDELDDSTRLQCFLNIIHLTGDLHCPGHVIYADKRDRGIGKFNVVYRGQTYTYHKVWDTMVTGETFAGGFMDLAYLADTADKKQIREWTKGSVYDWGTDVAKTSCGVWDIKEGDDLGNYFMFDHSHLALSLIARGGHRLAALLNEIFK